MKKEIDRALEILGLPTLITKQDIKDRYIQLARRYHPDIGGDSRRMEEINRAYELLNSYIDGFRYSFDDDEVEKRYPNGIYNERFEPFGNSKKDSKKGDSFNE